MIIGDRLREIREQQKLSQGDVEKKTGLLRCYISRVENGHTVPALETLEKMARAFDIPLYQLFYNGEEPPGPPVFANNHTTQWGSSGKDARFLRKLQRLLGKMQERDRQLLLEFTHKANQRKRKPR